MICPVRPRRPSATCSTGLPNRPRATATAVRIGGVQPPPHPPARFADDRGSTIPLILGFFLIALVAVGAAVALSDAFARQRDLQSICDGAALRAANAADVTALHGAGTVGGAVPLTAVDSAVQGYLADSAGGSGASGVRISGSLDETGSTVRLSCARHSRIAFGALIGRPAGIEQTAIAQARSPLAG